VASHDPLAKLLHKLHFSFACRLRVHETWEESD